MARNSINEHYFSPTPKGKVIERTITTTLRDKELTFFTGSGMFSPRYIDKGTQLLANKAKIDRDWRVLDLGCGYGPVGISIAKAEPSTTVVMTDVNKRAISFAKKNVKANKVTVTAVQGDKYEAVNEKFDTILLNPPQTAGKEVCFQMIEEAPIYLKKGGIFQLVARHRKGGKTLSEKMEDVFGNVNSIAKQGAYRIYSSTYIA